MKWPISVAPYDVSIIPMINKNDYTSLEKAKNINEELIKSNIDAIVDDTEENFSSKMKKMNLIGAPFQIIIGKQTEDELVEFKKIDGQSLKLKLEEVIKIIKEEKAKN